MTETGSGTFFDSAFMRKLQELGGAFQANKVVSAITGGLMGTMGLVLVGAIFVIIASMLSLFNVIEPQGQIYMWLNVPYNMTLNIMAVVVSFCMGYSYARTLEMKSPLTCGITTMVLFLLVAAPMKTVTLEDGTTTMNVLDTTFMGGTGLFTAIIVPLISVKIIQFCEVHDVQVKMPDSVPPFLADSFAGLVPLLINVCLWYGINTALEHFMGVNLPAALVAVITIPLGALVSIPGMFVLVFICMVLWTFGIHGSMVVMTVLMVPMFTVYTTNAALHAAGQPMEFSPIFLFSVVACCGGTGNVLPLAVLCMQSKSDQLRGIGKAGLIPAIFNISEPMAFGVPIMYNPLIAIPFILNPLVLMLIALPLYLSGILVPGYIMVMTVLPIGLGGFMTNLEPIMFIIPVIAFVVAYFLYLPFVKAYDRQLLEKERLEREAVEAREAAESLAAEVLAADAIVNTIDGERLVPDALADASADEGNVPAFIDAATDAKDRRKVK